MKTTWSSRGQEKSCASFCLVSNTVREAASDHTVRAPGRVSGGQNRLLDGFGDLRRFMERRGRVIQIDHTNPPAKIAAHVEPMLIPIA